MNAVAGRFTLAEARSRPVRTGYRPTFDLPRSGACDAEITLVDGDELRPGETMAVVLRPTRGELWTDDQLNSPLLAREGPRIQGTFIADLVGLT